jgi:hypothetical protein
VECAVFRGVEVSAGALRASYEAALDVIVKLVRETPELQRDTPAVREARAFLVQAERKVMS